MTKFPCNHLGDGIDTPVPLGLSAEIPFTVSVSNIKISPAVRVVESDIPKPIAVKISCEDLRVEYIPVPHGLIAEISTAVSVLDIKVI